MKTIVKKMAVVSLCMFAVVGCSKKRTLYVYNWSDYIDEELVAQFEEENDCSVVIDVFDDNETMLAKLMSGATGYDVIFPSSYMIPALVRHKLIAPLNTNLLPNVVANLDHHYDSIFHSGTLSFSVPYALSATGIAYRKDVFDPKTDADRSWDVLKSGVFQSRVSVLNDIREIIGIGLKKNGYSVNTHNRDEIAKALEYAKTLKSVARKLDSVQYRTGLVNGEFYAAIGYTCDILQVIGENPESPIGFFIPNEGSNCCWDEMVIAHGADKELAHKFIDFFYRPRVAAKNMKYICATVPNTGMWEFLCESDRSDPWLNMTDETLKKIELIEDVGDALELYVKAWDEFMSNKEAKQEER